MKENKIYWFLIYLILLVSCTNNDIKNNFKIIEINTKGISKEIQLSKITQEAKYVKLSTESEFLIGDIRNIVLNKNIYVQNLQKILVFTIDGSSLYKIDNKGKAAEEYYEINDFHIDTLNNVIEVWDRVKRKMFIYNNSTGELIREFKLNIDAEYFKKINTQYYFYSQANFSKKDNRVNRIVCIDQNGKISNEFLESDLVSLYSFSTPHVLSSSDEVLYYDDAPLNNIYSITEDKCKLAFHIDVDEKSMNVNDLLELRDLNSAERYHRMVDLYSYSTGITNVWKGGIYLEVRTNGSWYPCFYSFKNYKAIIGTNIYDDFYLNIPVWYSNICDNKLICQIPAHKILKSGVDYEPLANTNPELYNMLKGLKKFDNPILVISDLKEF